MARFSLVVYSNPVKGREQEYNDWYSNQHLSDLLAIPGVVAARRFKLSGTQIGEVAQTYQYLAIYDVEADDVATFIKEMTARTASGAIPVTTAMSPQVSPAFWDAL
jgi:phage/plasmid-associated DNA primase